MLSLSRPSPISDGLVKENLLNGQYRVLFDGIPTIATSQSGPLLPGQQITLAKTSAGLVVVAAGKVAASNFVEVTING